MSIVNAGVFTIGNKVAHKDIYTDKWYEEVAYLKGDGNAYIDTGLKRKSTFSYDFKFCFDTLSSVNYTNIFGCDERERGNAYKLYLYRIKSSNKIVIGDNSSYSLASTNCVAGTEYHYKIENKSAIINDTLYALGGWNDATNNDCIFWSRIQNPVSQDKLNGKFFWYKCFDGERPMRDMIPVKEVGGTTYGMFDKVENKFYGNANSTGSFTGGEPVLIDPL